MEVSQKKYNHIKQKAEEEYKQIDSVLCPYLRKKVIFNSKGLEHIKFKSRNKARGICDQYIRFRCLPLAFQILEKSYTLQGYQEKNEMVALKKKKKWSRVCKPVTYYEFVAVMKDNIRVRIIVKKIENGEPFFWSIIPFWRMDIYGNRKTYNGNPSED